MTDAARARDVTIDQLKDRVIESAKVVANRCVRFRDARQNYFWDDLADALNALEAALAAPAADAGTGEADSLEKAISECEGRFDYWEVSHTLKRRDYESEGRQLIAVTGPYVSRVVMDGFGDYGYDDDSPASAIRNAMANSDKSIDEKRAHHAKMEADWAARMEKARLSEFGLCGLCQRELTKSESRFLEGLCTSCHAIPDDEDEDDERTAMSRAGSRAGSQADGGGNNENS